MRSPAPVRTAGRVGAIAATLLLLTLPGFNARQARAAGYPDVSGQPADIRESIDYVTEMGYMNGAVDGKFYPNEPMGRMDYARALVKMFKNLSEEPDQGITFTDVENTDPEFRYANIAVRHGYLSAFPDGSFRPKDTVTAVDAMVGLVVGLKLEGPVQNLRKMYPRGPSYEGYSVVASDLHLRYRETRVLPGGKYPRAEMAYSLQMVDRPEAWRVEYVKENFNWVHCQKPWLGPLRGKAMDAAFSKIGYPYVWGGESDKERGYDCSGLVYYVLSSVMGHPMQRVADDQARDKRYPQVNRKELLAGDPIYFFDKETGDPAEYIGHAGMYIGTGMFIHSTGSNSGVSVDYLSGYWEKHFAWGKRVIDEPEPETFDTYILLCNPGSTAAQAKLTYMLPGGKYTDVRVGLEPRSRQTVRVDDTLVDQEVSTTVEATQGSVIAERSMYFDYRGRYPGGHDSPGVTVPSRQWYLPEGCTAWGFDTFVLVQNPGDATAQVMVNFLRSDGTKVDQGFPLAAHSRHTIAVDSILGMGRSEFSTLVTADRPVVVERSMYFDYSGIREGSNSPGVQEVHTDWYFAEGYTGKSFDTYILLMNPEGRDAIATLVLMADDGSRADFKVRVPAGSRKTVAVDDIKGWENKAFSAAVHSPDVPLAAERSMYFDYGGIKGGHDALGSCALSRAWYLAEGYTAQDFDTYILLCNPGASSASVCVRYMLAGGGFKDRRYEVPAYSRYTICVDKEEGLSAAEVSSYIISNVPIAAERSMYFKYGEVRGGSCAPGVMGVAPRWYFAEGYTGQ